MYTFVAKPSPWRMALLFAVAIAFVVGGAWLAGLLGEEYPHGREWLGWLCIVFFGICGAIGARRMFDREDVLRMGPTGLWYRHWSDDLIPWREITSVGVWEYKRQRTILLNLVDPARFPSSTLLGRLAGANRALTGGDIAISLTGTDRTFDDAMAAIRAYRPS